ncbi:MAG: hydantoinase/oxoprolinase N-terminal domain-containing protein, partial [Bacteroidota bacterium]
MNRYVIGIDTGGTFTDGVLLHYGTRKVVSAAKSLTTRDDLKKGVIKVLQKLDIKEDYNIKLVGISSTLATNSVAEGKARKVGLILIGYDRDLVESYGLIDKMSTEEIAFFQGGHNAQGA